MPRPRMHQDEAYILAALLILFAIWLPQTACYPVHIKYHTTQVFHRAVKEGSTGTMLEHFVIVC